VVGRGTRFGGGHLKSSRVSNGAADRRSAVSPVRRVRIRRTPAAASRKAKRGSGRQWAFRTAEWPDDFQTSATTQLLAGARRLLPFCSTVTRTCVGRARCGDTLYDSHTVKVMLEIPEGVAGLTVWGSWQALMQPKTRTTIMVNLAGAAPLQGTKSPHILAEGPEYLSKGPRKAWEGRHVTIAPPLLRVGIMERSDEQILPALYKYIGASFSASPSQVRPAARPALLCGCHLPVAVQAAAWALAGRMLHLHCGARR